MLKADQIIATAAHAERLDLLRKEIGILTSLDNIDAARKSETVLLCVKPQIAREVLLEVQGELGPDKLIVSIVASASTARLEESAGEGVPLVRVMPNTPSLVKAGMSVLSSGRWAREEHLTLVEKLFQPLGRTLRLDEHHMDAVTGLSASGPAFIYVVIESLAEGGVKAGLPAQGRNRTGGADRFRSSSDGPPNRTASCIAERRCHHARRMHGRWSPDSGRGRAASHADQGGSRGGASGSRTFGRSREQPDSMRLLNSGCERRNCL